MKIIIYILLATASVCIACEKIIDIDLNESDPKTVIVGKVYEGLNPVNVSISKTISFFEIEKPETISGASVTISDGSGNVVQLNDIGDGNYTANYNAVEGNTYTLTVKVNGEIFTSSSYLPPAVAFDTLFAESQGSSFGEIETFLVFFDVNDPVGMRNYYRILTTLNDTLLLGPQNFYLFDDLLSDGKHIVRPVFTESFVEGDKVEFTLASIDADVYNYFITLEEVLNTDGASSSPGNPVSNITGGALGYFAAVSTTSKTIIITK